MTNEEIRQWAANLTENDQRVNWQKRAPITGRDIARVVRTDVNATDDDLNAIASLINQK